MYQQGACAITQAIAGMNWKNYTIAQAGLPTGPLLILVHVASTSVPFTSESKDAIASIPEIEKEIVLALQDLGRDLKLFLARRDINRLQEDRARAVCAILPELAAKVAEIVDRDPPDISPIEGKIMRKLVARKKTTGDGITLELSNYTANTVTLSLYNISHDQAKDAHLPPDFMTELEGEYTKVWHITLDALDAMGVACFKLASADITYRDLVERVASKGKPVLISTGASLISEIEEAMRWCYQAGNRQIVLLQCTLKYPCPAQAVNLRMMEDLHRYGHPVGLSDHSVGLTVPFAAVALGAFVLEKHYTLRKSDQGSPDHHMSVDPQDLAQMVKGIRQVEAALGLKKKQPVTAEIEAIMYARRSVTDCQRHQQDGHREGRDQNARSVPEACQRHPRRAYLHAGARRQFCG